MLLFGFFLFFFAKSTVCEADTISNYILFVSPKEKRDDIHLDEGPKRAFSFLEYSGKDRRGNPYKKIVLLMSYAPDLDVLNQGGGALSYYLNPNVSLKTGPSWCKDIGINRKWKWACQLNFEIPIASH